MQCRGSQGHMQLTWTNILWDQTKSRRLYFATEMDFEVRTFRLRVGWQWTETGPRLQKHECTSGFCVHSVLCFYGMFC